MSQHGRYENIFESFPLRWWKIFLAFVLGVANWHRNIFCNFFSCYERKEKLLSPRKIRTFFYELKFNFCLIFFIWIQAQKDSFLRIFISLFHYKQILKCTIFTFYRARIEKINFTKKFLSKFLVFKSFFYCVFGMKNFIRSLFDSLALLMSRLTLIDWGCEKFCGNICSFSQNSLSFCRCEHACGGFVVELFKFMDFVRNFRDYSFKLLEQVLKEYKISLFYHLKPPKST